MNSLAGLILLACTAYVATNLDNFVLLVSLLARYRSYAKYVVAGYLVSVFVLLTAGMLFGEVVDVIPLDYLGLLGLIPLSIGVIGMLQLLRRPPDRAPLIEKHKHGHRAAFALTLLSQLGNGTDTLIAIGVLFADSQREADLAILLGIAASALLFVSLANYAIRHPALSEWVERYAYRITPFVLIAVGFYVLANTATDVVPN